LTSFATFKAASLAGVARVVSFFSSELIIKKGSDVF